MVWNKKARRQIYDYSQLQLENDLTEDEISSITKLRTAALKTLRKAIIIDSGFANSYYKRTEINLLWLGYNLWLHDKDKECATLDNMSGVWNNCEKDLSEARVRIGNTTKIEGYETSLDIIKTKLQNIGNHNRKLTSGKKRN